VRSPGPSASGTSPLRPNYKRVGPAGALTCHGSFHRLYQDHQTKPCPRPSADSAWPKSAPATWLAAGAERPDLGASIPDRRGAANRAERRISLVKRQTAQTTVCDGCRRCLAPDRRLWAQVVMATAFEIGAQSICSGATCAGVHGSSPCSGSSLPGSSQDAPGHRVWRYASPTRRQGHS
jgi:hypothetical protein